MKNNNTTDNNLTDAQAAILRFTGQYTGIFSGDQLINGGTCTLEEFIELADRGLFVSRRPSKENCMSAKGLAVLAAHDARKAQK